MPYLACSSCRLTVYNAPTVAAPKHCPRCHARLADGAASLFPSASGGRASAAELADLLRRRAAARGARGAPGRD